MPRSAAEFLSSDTDIAVAWAVFDPVWYIQAHPEAAHACADDPAAALDYYLRVGCRLGHSPSPLFDEQFYRDQNPDIAALVDAGRYRSGFDHYCQHGHRGLSPTGCSTMRCTASSMAI